MEQAIFDVTAAGRRVAYEDYSVIGLSHAGQVIEASAPDEASARELAGQWLAVCGVVEIYGTADQLVWSNE